MAAYPNGMFRGDFVKYSFVFRICFLWLTRNAADAAENGGQTLLADGAQITNMGICL